jgi:putative membrane protein
VHHFVHLDLNKYAHYRFYNSLFTGLSLGSIFIIYTPLQPVIYSIGGIVLALAMLLVAKLYVRILHRRAFFVIAMGIELVMLIMLLAFLLFGYGYVMALFVYVSYQLTFAFGSYFLRAETLFFRHRKAFTTIDVAKQYGYLAGMFGSFLFYELLEYGWQITQSQPQVYALHFLLVPVQLITMAYLILAFRKAAQ